MKVLLLLGEVNSRKEIIEMLQHAIEDISNPTGGGINCLNILNNKEEIDVIKKNIKEIIKLVGFSPLDGRVSEFLGKFYHLYYVQAQIPTQVLREIANCTKKEEVFLIESGLSGFKEICKQIVD